MNADDDIWLDRIEDILYFETDPDLTRDQVLEWGRRLRTSFHSHLPGYVAALELVDQPELYPFHADFLSRLALTFEHGDYARLDAISGKTELARRLYRKALEYHADARAYLGLGMQYQKSGNFSDSIEVLKQGHSRFPEDPQISICLAVSHLNALQFEQALDLLRPLDYLPQVLPFLIECCRELGLDEQVETYRRRMAPTGAGDR
jgi:tetratricopeptide (TPR) repeat protein